MVYLVFFFFFGNLFPSSVVAASYDEGGAKGREKTRCEVRENEREERERTVDKAEAYRRWREGSEERREVRRNVERGKLGREEEGRETEKHGK